jgi:hypothetical protein
MGESAKAAINLGTNGGRERSMSELLKDIIDTIQKIVRGEVRLAKAEVREEAINAWRPMRVLFIGAVVGLYAAAYLLLGIAHALALTIPAWASAGSVGLVLAVAAGIMISRGADRMKRVYAAPERIVETLKESLND